MEIQYSRSFSMLIILAAILCINSAPLIVAAEELDTEQNTSASRVAVVTGANKGIGFAIVKGLCERFDGIVYLTARNEERGRAAVEELNKVGLYPKFHQLDVTNDSSVETFKNYLNDKYGRLDVLVNNAGIAFQIDAPDQAGLYIQAFETMQVNYFGLLRVSEALFPLLKPHARVVQLSSSDGHLSVVPGDELKARLSSPELTEDELSQMMRDFLEAVKTNTLEAGGWPDNPYRMSKAGVVALTRVQQKGFDADDREDLVVNAVHPGFVKTDLTGHQGDFTPERGAQAPLYLALLPKNTDIKGQYVWHDNTVVDWVNGPLPDDY